MKKSTEKVNQILNIVIGCNVGVFIGHSLTVITDYRKYSDLYALQSAPWYSSILIYGIFTVVIVMVALVIKAIGRSGLRMDNSFAAVHPKLVSEWSKKNLPFTPDKITFGSDKIYRLFQQTLS